MADEVKVKLWSLPAWQIGWLAGIIDGEGSISLSLKSVGQRGILPKVAVTIAMTDELTIRTIAKLIGMGTITKETKRRMKPIWRWRTYTKGEMYILLKTISPCMLTKAKQARLTIKYLERRIADVPLDAKLIKQMQGMNK